MTINIPLLYDVICHVVWTQKNCLGWCFGTMEFYDFPIILGMKNHPNWLSLHHFSEGFKPPTSNNIFNNIQQTAIKKTIWWTQWDPSKTLPIAKAVGWIMGHGTIIESLYYWQSCDVTIHIFDVHSYFHRIGWWENLQESPIFDGKNHGFRLRFSLKPIQWYLCPLITTINTCFWKSPSALLYQCFCLPHESDPSIIIHSSTHHISSHIS